MKSVEVVISHDLDFLIHFQKTIINKCANEGFDPRIISAMQDIKTILEATKEIGILTDLPQRES